MDGLTNSSQWARRLPRILLGVLAVVLISLLYPNNLTFPYQFELNQTWQYADLTAPYSIPILKREERLAADRQAVLKNLTPVYQRDPQIARRARAEYIEEFRIALDSARARNNYPGLLRQPEAHRLYGLELLDRIYQRGIVNLRTEDEARSGMASVIQIVDGSEVNTRTIGQVFTTPGRARQWLTDSILYTRLAAPDFLLPLLENRLRYNVFYNDSLTNRLREQTLEAVSPFDGLVEQGDILVRQGEVISDNVYQKLVSYRRLYNSNLQGSTTFLSVYTGFTLIVGLVILLLYLYLRTFFPFVYVRIKNLVFILMWPLLYAIMVRSIELAPGWSAYVVPFCIVPIVMRIFFSERLAFFVHVAVVLIASFLTSLGYPFTFLSIMAGVVVIFMDIDTRDWSRFFSSLLLLFAFYLFGYVGIQLVQGSGWSGINYVDLLWLGLNVFLVLLAYPLIPMLERFFGLISPITLMELNDMNRPLLEKLARQAAGTWQHSLNVANLAERVASEIGIDSLLVRTAALYHDIGKLKNPEYFIENQTGPNPHDRITDLESAKIIIDHVNEGVRLARVAGLPETIIDFIRTHHGTTRTEYFYRNHIKNHPEREADEPYFRYDGPLPTTKEQTVLMLADSVEAASKSLKQPTQEELYELIDNIIRGKLTNGQLVQSRLSFHELESLRRIFRSVLKSSHQLRIAYPAEARAEEAEEE
ncbi:HD family phosphohydrolase [Neolewinella litorea]|uniref:HDIG domain-containing protein n=1 Tax=Neolewinella litorea TaxID=2562452 RepID=A0A4S4NRV6_9BACT|nr:HDIG domain-containing metalloprotein [Neolewinella litorea]THH41141.1 HDIG domain-containing protein [Neolewinella litorea]